MKKILGLFVLMGLLSSCGDDDGNLTLNFKALYDGSSFLMFDELPYGDGTIQITDSDFFISNISVTNEDNEVFDFENVAFVDFTNTNIVTDPASKERGIDIPLGNLPTGNYTKIRFGIGLDEVKNATVPADYSSSEVLSMVSHYWSVWDSYIFMKLQGLYTNSAQGHDDLGFVFHIGNDALYREVELPIDLTVTSGENKINLALEHKSLFTVDDQLFDIPSSPSNHQPVLNGPMFMIVDNFGNSFLGN